jgi:RNA polymerase sigma-70 factor (ECF subfamily)
VPTLDATTIATESRDLVLDLRAEGTTGKEAVARLHDLLLRAARFEVARRNAAHHFQPDAAERIAAEAAEDALADVRAHLDDYRGDSRFTTWVWKFAILQAAVKMRRLAWDDRDRSLELDPKGQSETRETHGALGEHGLTSMLRVAMAEVLTSHERDVLVALAVDGVPIDVLAQQLNTTRGELYQTLHDARKGLRQYASARGVAVD